LFHVGYEQGEEEVDDTEPSSSSSSPGVNLYGEDFTLELVDDSFEIDGEVGKRLNQMVPIPVSSHVLDHLARGSLFSEIQNIVMLTFQLFQTKAFFGMYASNFFSERIASLSYIYYSPAS
jgi:hypothetical protein